MADKCTSTMTIGADDQKTPTTFHCDREKEHTHNHQERGNAIARDRDGRILGTQHYTITWGDPMPNPALS